MRYFAHEHLRDDSLKDVSRKFGDLAADVDQTLPDGPEKSVALRKLLEAKDAAVRAALPPRDTPQIPGEQEILRR